MNNSMNFFKRLTAFLLVMLLVTSMVGDDFSALAGDEVQPEIEQAAADAPAAEEYSADVTPDFVEEPVAEPVEEVPEELPTNEELPAQELEEEIPTTPEEVVTVDEEITVEETPDEDNEEIEEELNDDYELRYTTMNKVVDGLNITVKGMMPEGSTVDVRTVSKAYAKTILVNMGEGEYEVYKALDIEIRDADGNIYQPENDGGSVELVVKGVNELRDVPDEEVEVLRVEHDYRSITALDSDVNGTEVVFESEHFSLVIIGTSTTSVSESDYITISSGDDISFTGSIDSQSSSFARIKGADIQVYLRAGESISYTATLRKKLSASNKPLTGTVVGTYSNGDEGETVSEAGWYTLKAEFPADESLAWSTHGTSYSVTFNVNNANIKLKTGSASVYINGESTSNNGAFSPYTETSDSPYSISEITISSMAGKANVNNTIYYKKGETDTLIGTAEGYNLDYTWQITEVTKGQSPIVITNAGGLTANNPGEATVRASYGGVYADVTIVVYGVLIDDQSTYTATYTGTPIEPTIKLNDGAAELEASASTFSVTYTDSNKAGTAKATINGSNGRFSFDATYIIEKRSIADFTFTKTGFTIDTNSDVVSAVTGISFTGSGNVNTVVTPSLGQGFSVRLSRTGVTSTGIKYDATITGLENYTGSQTVKDVVYKSTGMNLADYVEVEWADSNHTKTYTGDEITYNLNDFVFKDKNGNILEDLDLQLSYENNINGDSTGTVYFEDKSTPATYTGRISQSFYIAPADLNAADYFKYSWQNNKSSFPYDNGKEVKPGDKLTLTYQSPEMSATRTLEENKDYTLSYSNNKNVGNNTAIITITGKGNYIGTQQVTFSIEANFATQAIVYINGSYKAEAPDWNSGYTARYTGSDIKPEDIRVYLPGKSNLTKGTDYTVDWKSENGGTDVKGAGRKYVEITGINNYSGTITAYYEIKPVNIGGSLVTFTVNGPQTYTGKPIELTTSDYVLKYNGTSLVKGTDYEISFDRNTNITSAASVVLEGKGNFTGERESTFEIEPANFSDAVVNFEGYSVGVNPSFPYTGTAIEPEIEVSLNGVPIASSNYTKKYNNNIPKGSASVTLTPKNNLTGSARILYFTISSKSLKDVIVRLDDSEVGTKLPKSTTSTFYYFCSGFAPTYTGYNVPKKIEVEDSGVPLTKGTDYVISFYNNDKVSIYNDLVNKDDAARVEIKGKGNYAGSTIVVYYDIVKRQLNQSTTTISPPDGKTEIHAAYVNSSTEHKPSSKTETPELVVKYGDTVLTEDVDYTIEIVAADKQKSKSAGEGINAEVVGKGNYDGRVAFTYSVGTKITGATVTLKNPYSGSEYRIINQVYQVDYLGKVKSPKHEIKVDGVTLSDSAYTVDRSSNQVNIYDSFENNNLVTVTLTGTGGYYGEVTYKYQILKVDLDTSPNIHFYEATNATNSSNSEGYALPYERGYIDVTNNHLTIKYELEDTADSSQNYTETLVYGEDYLLDKQKIGPSVGTFDVTATGLRNFKGSEWYRYVITEASINSDDFTIKFSDSVNAASSPLFKDGDVYKAYYNNGTPIELNDLVEIYDKNNKPLVLNTDFTIGYNNTNVNPGTCTITATGIGNYKDTKTITFQIVQLDASDKFDIRLEKNIYKYTGKKYTAADLGYSVWDGNTKLVEGTHYELVGDGIGSNIEPGSDDNYIEVQGLGHYTGTKKKNFTIRLDLNDLQVDETVALPEAKSKNEPILATVTLNRKSYNLTGTNLLSDSSVTIKYFDITGNELGQISNSATETNYTIEKPSVPGPVVNNGGVRIVGQGCLTGTVKFNNVNMLAKLSSRSSLDYAYASDYMSITGGDYPYTGSDIKPAVVPAYGIENTDYTVEYPNDISSVGEKKITIKATSDSRYYENSTQVELKYYIKYNLTTAKYELTLNNKTLTSEPYTTPYTGSEINYGVKITCAGTTIFTGTKDTASDYVKLSHSDSFIKPGDHSISVKKLSNDVMAMGEKTIAFRIVGISIENAEVTLQPGDVAGGWYYTGFSITPLVQSVTITTNGVTTTLSERIDYTVDWGNNTAVTDNASVIITGQGAYTGTKIKAFSILKKPLVISDTSGISVTNGDAHYVGGDPVKPTIEVQYANGSVTKKLIEGTDYTVTYPMQNNQATDVSGVQAEATIEGIGNYTGTISHRFDIEKLELLPSNVTITDNEAEFTGEPIEVKPVVTVKNYDNKPKQLEKGTDYTVSFKKANGEEIEPNPTTQKYENIKKGTYYIEISAATNSSCLGKVSVEYKVTSRSLAKNWHREDGDNKEITITVPSVETFTDKAEPHPVIVDTGVAAANQNLELGTDYTVEYFNNTTGAEGKYDDNGQPAEGSPYVLIRGKGNYSDEDSDAVKVVFNVGKDINNCTVVKEGTYITQFDYNGQEQIPSLEVRAADDTVVDSENYVVSVDDPINAGEKIIKITGQNKYYGTREETYRINARDVSPGYSWTNKYSDTGTDSRPTNQEVNGFTLELEDVSVLSTADSSKLYGTTAYAGYYYKTFEKAFAENGGFKPTVRLYDVDIERELVEDVDYTVTYDKNNIASNVNTTAESTEGLAFAQIELKGNYCSTASNQFMIYYIITRGDIANDNTFNVDFNAITNTIYRYNGEPITPEVTVSNNSLHPLVKDKDYKIYYSSKDYDVSDETTKDKLDADGTDYQPWEPGMGYVYVVGQGSYQGIKKAGYEIKAYLNELKENKYGYDLGDVVIYNTADNSIIQIGIPTQFLTGDEIKPTNVGIILYKKGGTLANKKYIKIAPSDLSLEYGSEDEEPYTSTGWVRFNGVEGTFITGTYTEEFDIELDANLIRINEDGAEYQFNGAQIKPAFTTPYSNIVVDETKTTYSRPNEPESEVTDEDFFIKVGTIKAKVFLKIASTGASIGNRSYDVTYTIVPRNISDCTLVMNPYQRFTGQQIKPAFTIFITNPEGQYTLKEGEDYAVIYGTNIKNTGNIRLNAAGLSDSIEGETFKSFTISLGAVGGLTVSSDGNTITANWINDIYSDGAKVQLEKIIETDGVTNYVNADPSVYPVTLTKSTDSYTFTGLDSNSNYRVVAYSYNNQYGIESARSNRDVRTGIAKSKITIDNSVAGRISITWPKTGEVVVYRIYKGTEANKSSCSIIASYPVSTGGFTNSNLSSGSTYYYYLVGYARNSSGALEKYSESDLLPVTVK